jgi:hypothetical protein
MYYYLLIDSMGISERYCVNIPTKSMSLSALEQCCVIIKLLTAWVLQNNAVLSFTYTNSMSASGQCCVISHLQKAWASLDNAVLLLIYYEHWCLWTMLFYY